MLAQLLKSQQQQPPAVVDKKEETNNGQEAAAAAPVEEVAEIKAEKQEEVTDVEQPSEQAAAEPVTSQKESVVENSDGARVDNHVPMEVEVKQEDKVDEESKVQFPRFFKNLAEKLEFFLFLV